MGPTFRIDTTVGGDGEVYCTHELRHEVNGYTTLDMNAWLVEDFSKDYDDNHMSHYICDAFVYPKNSNTGLRLRCAKAESIGCAKQLLRQWFYEIAEKLDITPRIECEVL